MTAAYTRPPQRLTFCLSMAALLGAIFVRNVFGFPIPVIMLLGIAADIALLGDRDEIAALIICCIPLSAAFQYKYLLILAILIYAVKYRDDLRITWNIVPLYLLMLWELLHGIFYDFSFYTYLRDFSELIFLAFLLSITYKAFDYPMICRMLAICSICMMSIVLLNLFNRVDQNLAVIFTGSYRFSVGNDDAVNFGVNYNANRLGFICNLATLGLLQLRLVKQHRPTDTLLMIALILFGALTMSRSYFLCLALIFLLYILAGTAGAGEICKRFVSIVLILSLILALICVFAPIIVQNTLARFREEDITNGRIGLFAFYHAHIFSSAQYMLFGIGLQDFADKMIAIHGDIVNVCHNGIQEIVVCWGFPGLILFAWFLCEMLACGQHCQQRSTVHYLPLILLLVQIQAGQFVRNEIMLLALSFVYISLCWTPEKECIR